MFSSNVLHKTGQFELGSKMLEPHARCYINFLYVVN